MKYLTITVPCFNSEEHLKRCLDSLMAGGDDVEIIVVNDGSTDRTGEIAESYARRFPEIVTVVHKENGGHGSEVNTGLRLASGKWTSQKKRHPGRWKRGNTSWFCKALHGYVMHSVCI